MKVIFAEKCAWRGIYLHRNNGRQIFRITVDPGIGSSFGIPTINIAFMGRQGFRCNLPHIPWRWVMKGNYSKFRTALYKLSQRFWFAVDGRYTRAYRKELYKTVNDLQKTRK